MPDYLCTAQLHQRVDGVTRALGVDLLQASELLTFIQIDFLSLSAHQQVNWLTDLQKLVHRRVTVTRYVCYACSKTTIVKSSVTQVLNAQGHRLLITFVQSSRTQALNAQEHRC